MHEDLTHPIFEKLSSARTSFERGLLSLQHGDYPAAMQNLDKAIELEPRHPQAYAYRATVHEVLGSTDRALHDACKAIEMDPTFH